MVECFDAALGQFNEELKVLDKRSKLKKNPPSKAPTKQREKDPAT